MSAEPDCDVLICGLGPVGQLLALLLGRAGVSVLAIDEASKPFELPRAAVVDDEVLRIFQAAGVEREILAESQRQEEVSFVTVRGRAQCLLQPINGSQGHPPLVSIHQPSIERTLIAALAEQETVRVAWGRRLERFEQDGEGVRALVRSVEDGSTEEIRARWAVGCDGGGSWVRQLLGIEFGGSTFRQRWLVVDALVDRPLAKVRHPHFFGDWRRPIVSLPMSPGRHRWEWMLHPGEDPEPFTDPDSLRERIDPWLEGETAIVERAVVYTFHARTAARWREGRVLLAGDAAHLMPPFAGQGFSSGARDAANLAWKVEAVLAGAPEGLLDTYEQERRPHVEAMRRLAVTLGSFVQTADRRVARVRDAFLGTLAITGIASWARTRIKPLPAYAAGAFAERPHRIVFKRCVGAQFPQPVVRVGGEKVLLDEVAGRGWCAFSADSNAADALGAEGLRVLLLGHDLEDSEGTIGEWLTRFEASWVLLRPDRFVFALGGSGGGEVRRALDALHRQLGRATSELIAARNRKISQPLVAA
ncbi:MAG TPA: bifunctional 3-(3-hydroxy-phenyl)propionate/3-hydroxycinnamic acid hydroxylase [Solirubrobacterales bacterium]|nr:bifunctional 3-(3-hydroxy-phenyl)propionate/3-hydroxycinnamic acid hydroxylase [Solirubrobacterales bacterium]